MSSSVDFLLSQWSSTSLNSINFDLYSDSEPPVISVISQSRTKLSSHDGVNECVVSFVSNQDLSEWESRIGGTGPQTGELVQSGGPVTAGREFSVSYLNLNWGDMKYRVNIYGKSTKGVWNSYE